MSMATATVDLQRLLDAEGRVTRWPTRERERVAVLAYLAGKFRSGESYREAEVNEVLKRYHLFGDWALLRRELYQRGYLDRARDGTRYWRTALAS